MLSSKPFRYSGMFGGDFVSWTDRGEARVLGAVEADLLEDAQDVVDAEPGHDVVTSLGRQAAA